MHQAALPEPRASLFSRLPELGTPCSQSFTLFTKRIARSVGHRSRQQSTFFLGWGEECRNPSRRCLGESWNGFFTVWPGSLFPEAPRALPISSPWSGNRELPGSCLTVRTKSGSFPCSWFFFDIRFCFDLGLSDRILRLHRVWHHARLQSTSSWEHQDQESLQDWQLLQHLHWELLQELQDREMRELQQLREHWELQKLPPSQPLFLFLWGCLLFLVDLWHGMWQRPAIRYIVPWGLQTTLPVAAWFHRPQAVGGPCMVAVSWKEIYKTVHSFHTSLLVAASQHWDWYSTQWWPQFRSVTPFLNQFRQTSWTCQPCPSDARPNNNIVFVLIHPPGLEGEQQSHSVSDVRSRYRRNTTSWYGLLCTDQRSRWTVYVPVAEGDRDFNSISNQIWPVGML